MCWSQKAGFTSLVARKVVLHETSCGIEAPGEKVISPSVVTTTLRRRPHVGDVMTLTPFCSVPVSFFQIKAEGRAGPRPRVFGGWLYVAGI